MIINLEHKEDRIKFGLSNSVLNKLNLLHSSEFISFWNTNLKFPFIWEVYDIEGLRNTSIIFLHNHEKSIIIKPKLDIRKIFNE